LPVKPVFHSRISPPAAKKIEKEITFSHSFAPEEICSASLDVENVQLLRFCRTFSMIEQKDKGLNFSVGGEIFRQRQRNT
jgi:hypothetical protein